MQYTSICDLPLMLTIEEAADLIRVSKNTVCRLYRKTKPGQKTACPGFYVQKTAPLNPLPNPFPIM